MNTFNRDGVHLAYRLDKPLAALEDAPVLVLVNSLGTNMHMWDAQMTSLSKYLCVLRYDSRGHGASDVPPGPYSIDLLGQDLLALLNELAIECAHICGLSLGGIVAQWVAAQHPERVDHVIFANTAAHIGTHESWTTRIDAVRSGGMAAIRDMVVARFLSEDFRREHAEETRAISEMVAQTNPQGYIAACEALRDADLHSLLPRITAPSLIIGGELDESTPPALAGELHESIVGSELIVFPRVAHLSNVERPQEFSQLLLNFLIH